MLTGESAPVLKSSLPLDASEQDKGQYDPTLERDSKYRLLSGTKVVQVKRPLGPPTASVNSKLGLSSVWDFDLPIDKSGKKRVRPGFSRCQHILSGKKNGRWKQSTNVPEASFAGEFCNRNPLGDLTW
jgi:hypothetical protein